MGHADAAARAARRERRGLVSHDVRRPGVVGRPEDRADVRRCELRILRVGQRHEGGLQRRQPAASRLRHHDARDAWPQRARGRGLPLLRRLVPRMPGLLAPVGDLPQRLTLVDGKGPRARCARDDGSRCRVPRRNAGYCRCREERRHRCSARVGRSHPARCHRRARRPGLGVDRACGLGLRGHREGRVRGSEPAQMDRRDAVPLPAVNRAEGRQRTRHERRTVARRVPRGRDQERPAARQRPSDPDSRRQPPRARARHGPGGDARPDDPRHRVDEAAQLQPRPHVALSQRAGVVRPLRRVRPLRHQRGQRRVARPRVQPRPDARQQPRVGGGPRRTEHADGRDICQPPLGDHLVDGERGGRRGELPGGIGGGSCC